MIAYRIARAELERRIEAYRQGWLNRASQRTDHFRALRKYEETGSIWSEVKAVYMELQGGSKCAYCERKLESVTYGKGEQDIEHFRPKGKVVEWSPSAALLAEGVQITAVPDGPSGYFLLPYDLFNYSAACDPCNSILKRNYFPIAGERQCNGAEPEKLMDEKPLLLYPIGDFDDDPETLIRFHGIAPQAVKADGHDRHRGLVTIEIFRLDDAARGNLRRERAMIISLLYPQLEILRDQTVRAKHPAAVRIIEGCTSASAPHTNCARSFRRLYDRDPDEAREIFEAAGQLIHSKS